MSVGFDRSTGGDERLAGDLATKDALTVFIGTDAPEQVHLELFELENVDQVVEGASHQRGD
jgi:hypothetical protein